METPDVDFGHMQYNGIDAWDCRVEFHFPHDKTHFFAVHVWAPENGPTAKQRIRFREFKRRYESLWPDIASRIIALHNRLETMEDVGAAISESVSVQLGEHAEDSVEIVIELDLPGEGFCGYFLPLEEWEVGDAVVAE